MTVDEIIAIAGDAGPVIGGALLFMWGMIKLNGGIGAVRMRDDTTAAIENITQRVQYLEAKVEMLEGRVGQHESKIAVFDDRWDRREKP
jgi:hypothetical protein